MSILSVFSRKIWQSGQKIKRAGFSWFVAAAAFVVSLCGGALFAHADTTFCSDKIVTGPIKGLFAFSNLLTKAGCWFDKPLEKLFDVADEVGRLSYEALCESHFLLVVLGFGFAFWLAFKVWSYVSSFYAKDQGDFYTQLAVGGFRVLVVACLLGWGATELFDNFIGIFVTTAGDVTTDMVLGTLRTEVCASNPSEKLCDYESVDSASGAKAVYYSVSKLLTAVNFKFKIATAVGQGLTYGGWVKPWPIELCVPNFGIMFAGIFICLFSFYFMFSVPLKMVDLAMRIALIYALMPFFIVAWAFPLTRRYAKIGWGMVMYVAIYLLMFGVFACVAAALMTVGVSNDNIKNGLNGDAEGFLGGFIGANDESETKDFFLIFISLFISVKAFKSLATFASHIADGNDMGMGDSIGKALSTGFIKLGQAGAGLVNAGVSNLKARAGESRGIRQAARRQAMSDSSKPSRGGSVGSSNVSAELQAIVNVTGNSPSGKGGVSNNAGGSDKATGKGSQTGGAIGNAHKRSMENGNASIANNGRSVNDMGRNIAENNKSGEESRDQALKNAMDKYEKVGEKYVDRVRKGNEAAVDRLLKKLDAAKDRQLAIIGKQMQTSGRTMELAHQYMVDRKAVANGGHAANTSERMAAFDYLAGEGRNTEEGKAFSRTLTNLEIVDKQMHMEGKPAELAQQYLKDCDARANGGHVANTSERMAVFDYLAGDGRDTELGKAFNEELKTAQKARAGESVGTGQQPDSGAGKSAADGHTDTDAGKSDTAVADGNSVQKAINEAVAGDDESAGGGSEISYEEGIDKKKDDLKGAELHSKEDQKGLFKKLKQLEKEVDALRDEDAEVEKQISGLKDDIEKFKDGATKA